MLSCRISDNIFVSKYVMLSCYQTNITLDSVVRSAREGIKKLASTRAVAERTIFDKLGRQMTGNVSDWYQLLYEHIIKRANGYRDVTDFQRMLYKNTTLAHHEDECQAIELL